MSAPERPPSADSHSARESRLFSSPATGAEVVRELLQRSTRGDPQAANRVAELLYADLRREAQRLFSAERASHTLQPTALIHESFLRLLGQDQTDWQGREHFLAVASKMMRRVLIDHARRRLRSKRGGARRKVALQPDLQIFIDEPEDVLAVHDALEKLQQFDARQARIVELRFFGGMTNEEVARALNVSLRTVEAEWTVIRAWLRRELSREG